MSAEHELYRTWDGIKQRCLNPNHTSYKDYGGRGITICQEWADSFERFAADIGPRAHGKTLDRIDNDGGYQPGNVRWASPLEQLENSRCPIRPRYLTHDGKTLSQTEWARRAGIPVTTLSNRLARGWSLAEALLVPKGRHIRRARVVQSMAKRLEVNEGRK